jgi:hypothetical protein
VEELQQLNNRMIDANRQHVGATAELRFIGSKILRVEVVDTVDQHRFARRPEHLAEWRSSSRVIPRKSQFGLRFSGPGEPGWQRRFGCALGSMEYVR